MSIINMEKEEYVIIEIEEKDDRGQLEKEQNSYGISIIKKPSKIIQTLEKGNIKTVFNLIVLNIGDSPLIISSGIEKRTFNKYKSGYYEHLEKADTERLIKAINELYIPKELHRELSTYPNIMCLSYKEQDEQRQKERQENKEKIKKMVEQQNDHTIKNNRKRGFKTGGRVCNR